MASLNRSCQLLALHLILTAHAAAGMRYGLQQRRSLLVVRNAVSELYISEPPAGLSLNGHPELQLPSDWQGGIQAKTAAVPHTDEPERTPHPLQEPDLMVGYGQGSILPPHNTGSGSGCIVFPDLLPPGQALVDPEDNLQPSVEECCRSCREMEECNVFWYCGEQVRRVAEGK